MKKILQRIGLVFLAVVVVGVGSLIHFLTYDPEQVAGKTNTPTVTDPDGNKYLAVVDPEGTTYAAVTDKDGNIYSAEIKPDGSIGETLGDINGQIDIDSVPKNEGATNTQSDNNGQTTAPQTDANGQTVPQTEPTVPQTDENGQTVPQTQPTAPQTDANGQTVPQTQPTVPQTDANGQTVPQTQPQPTAPQVSTNDPNALVAYRIDKYQKIFTSGEYLMEFKTNDDSLGTDPITLAIKNGNIIIDANMESYECQMLYLANKDTTYMIIKNFKKYCKLPEDLLGDLDMKTLTNSNVTSNIGEITVSTIEEDSKTYICESYFTGSQEDGSWQEIRYIFDGETLIRRENISLDGSVDTTEIYKILSDVPDSTFEIPKGYGYLNLGWLDMFA